MQTPLPIIPKVGAKAWRCGYLDALRGWAILGVMMTHCVTSVGCRFDGSKLAFSGRYGVQLFFLVSAFTIFLTLDRTRPCGRREWTEFVIRRFFRVLPMFWAGLALYAFVPGRAPADTFVSYNALDYGLTALLQHGWHPALINSLVPGGWSVAVEGTFYLFAPFLYRGIRGLPSAFAWLAGSIALAEAANRTLVYLYLRHHLLAGVPVGSVETFISCWFPTQFPAFACGILVYDVAKAFEKRSWGRLAGTLLVVVSGVTCFLVTDIGKHVWVTQNVFFALAFLPLIVGLKIYPAKLLVNRVTEFVGRISYSVYILHFAMIFVAKKILFRTIPASWQGGAGEAFLMVYVVTVLLTMPLAWLTYRYLEQPCIALGARLIRYLRAPARGPASLAPLAWSASSAQG